MIKYIGQSANRAFGWLALALSVGCTPQAPTPTQPQRPDLSGVWMAFASVAPDGAGTPQYSAEGQAALDAFAAQYSEIPEAGAYCVPSGMPRVMLSTVSYPVEILQSDTRITMLAELEMQVRRVFMDGRGHPDDSLPTGVGHSIGHWEEDQLVIDTTLLEDWSLPPWPRGANTHIEERLYLTKRDAVSAEPSGFVASLGAAINDNVLVDEITLTDPTFYAGPQKQIAYYQQVADTATLEYACSTELWLEELEKYRVQ